MEGTNKNLSCRTCLESNGNVHPLTYTSSDHEDINFAVMLMSCTSICIDPDDSLPHCICERCLTTLIVAYDFKQQCEKFDLLLRKRQRKSVRKQEDVGGNIEKSEQAESKEIADQHQDHTYNITDPNLQKKRKKSKKSPQKAYKCAQCNKELTTRLGLAYHSRNHATDKSFSCPIENCKRAFSWKPTLKRHMQTHSNERPFLCYLCGKGYSAADSLRYHIRTHQGERPHLCVHCGKTFKQAGHLTYHLNSHTGNRQHVCPKCKRTYMGLTQLNRHLRKYCGVGREPPKKKDVGES